MDIQRVQTENVYGRDYRSGERTKEIEMSGMGGCMQTMQHTTAATASVQCPDATISQVGQASQQRHKRGAESSASKT